MAEPLDSWLAALRAVELEFTSIDMANAVVKPHSGRSTRRFNIRHNDCHSQVR